MYQVIRKGRVGDYITFCFLSSIVMKGISSNLMKLSAKRRRSKIQIEEEKRNEEILRQQTEDKLAQLEHMEQEVREIKTKAQRTN